MTGRVILTTSPTFATVGDVAARIDAAGFRLLRVLEPGPALEAALACADYLVAGLIPVTSATVKAAPKLRAVLKHGVGVDSIDIPASSAAGVAVTSAPGLNAQAVAEMALGAIFALSRNVVPGHLSVTSGGWDRRRGREVAGATLGIIGFGQIGRRLAGMARGIGMDVIAYDPFPDHAAAGALGVTLLSFDDVIARADAVSLHLAGGPDTVNLINAAVMDRMRPGAFLLNFARGTIVDLDALTGALTSGHLGGAAIDAYATEPPDTAHPIFGAPNVLFSPHSGADTVQAIERVSARVLDDILALEAGGTPASVLNPEALKKR